MDRDFTFELTDEAKESFIQNLNFIARGERVEETELFSIENGAQVLTGRKVKTTKDPKIVLQSMLVLDALTGGTLGIAKATSLLRGNAVDHVNQPKRLPVSVDESVISNTKSVDQSNDKSY